MITRVMHSVGTVVIAAAVVGCGGGGGAAPASSESAGTPEAATSAAGAGATLAISGFAFKDVSAAPGAAITVDNTDPAPHTVTADDGMFDVSVDASSTATLTAPEAAGSYAFTCKIHPRMRGTLTVL